MPDPKNESPCLVHTGQGDSVIYRSKYLYSKYAPRSAIEKIILSLHILPGTAVLCCSPCLCYGIDMLLSSLPSGCMAFGCEHDENLFTFSKPYTGAITAHTSTFFNVPPELLAQLPVLLSARRPHNESIPLPPAGTFRRVIRIDFSAGTQFAGDFYRELDAACENAVGQFWKNRITLVKFGRRFSRNLFRNLSRIPDSIPLQTLFGTITKPIVVCGAGESIDDVTGTLSETRRFFYVIAADAAVPALIARGITPDAAVCEESQSVIADAFLGTTSRNITLFAGITSWPGTAAVADRHISYFASRYDDTYFFDRLAHSDFFPPVLPPLGSVGLTATQIALLLRADETVPVYIAGLDFSYTVAATHARGTPAHKRQLAQTTRIRMIGNYDAAFSASCREAAPESRTTAVLSEYAAEFTGYFSGTENLFDTRAHGLPLGIPRRPLPVKHEQEPVHANVNGFKKNSIPPDNLAAAETKQHIQLFYETEKRALTELRSILTGELNIEPDELDRRIQTLLAEREYLYLHFPDGYALCTEPQFLKRVRAEIDYFLKDIETAERILEQQ